jgi:hypothetical protein
MSKRHPWMGIEYAEKLATLWHNRLAHIILYGIDERGRENLVLADTELSDLLQQTVPGNQKHRVARWWEHKKASLHRMWRDALEVAEGTRAPKLGRRDPKKHVPVGGATHPRSLPAFKKETKALLRARGASPKKATSLVHRHRADVKRAWSRRQPPCAATDKIVKEERHGMHGKRDPERLYRVVAINDRTRRKEVVASGPLTHREAMTVISKFHPRPRGARGVRFMVEETGRRDPKRRTMKKKSAKFERCVKDVKRSGTAKNPWAVCHAALSKKAKHDPRHDTRDLVRFVWSRVPKDYKLTRVDGRRGTWIMTPERSEYRGGFINLSAMPRRLLLDLARRHFGYRG